MPKFVISLDVLVILDLFMGIRSHLEYSQPRRIISREQSWQDFIRIIVCFVCIIVKINRLPANISRGISNNVVFVLC